MRLTLFSIMIFSGTTFGGIACDLCSVYNAPLSHGIIVQGWHVSFAEQFTHFGTLQLDGSKVANSAHQWMDSSISQMAVGYHFTDRIGIQVNLPYIHRSYRRAEGENIEKGNESGSGDVSLSGNLVVWRRDGEKWSVVWNVLGGVKFPTGDASRLREELAEEVPGPDEVESGIHGHDLALGSGSYDGFVGTELLVRRSRWFMTFATQYAIRGRGDLGYRYANDLTWSGGPGAYLVFGEELTVGLQANLSGESKGRDHFRGGFAEDTSITTVFVGPRLNLSWLGKFSAEAGVGVPVHLENSALQSVPDYRVQGACSWRF